MDELHLPRGKSPPNEISLRAGVSPPLTFEVYAKQSNRSRDLSGLA